MTEVMAAEIEKLIERLEKLTGPDARVDDAIQAHCVPRSERTIQAPRYTKSIDAALTLANGYDVAIHIRSLKMAEIWTDSRTHFYAYGATPAIALCIAALRALSHKGSSNV